MVHKLHENAIYNMLVYEYIYYDFLQKYKKEKTEHPFKKAFPASRRSIAFFMAALSAFIAAFSSVIPFFMAALSAFNIANSSSRSFSCKKSVFLGLLALPDLLELKADQWVALILRKLALVSSHHQSGVLLSARISKQVQV